MSSSTKDILEEFPLYSKELDSKKNNLFEVVEFLNSHRPRIIQDKYFQERLRQKLLEIVEENELIRIRKDKRLSRVIKYLYSLWIPISTTAFSCFIITIVFLHFIPTDTHRVPQHFMTSTSTGKISELVITGSIQNSLEGNNSISSKKILEDKDIQKIDSEISGIMNDINLSIGDVTSSKKQSQERGRMMIPNMDHYAVSAGMSMMSVPSMPESVLPNEEGNMVSMELVEIESGLLVPEYPSKVNIYKKTGPDFTQVELISHTGFGIVGIEMDTEKNTNLLRSKIRSKIGESKIVSGGKISYIPLKKIGKSSPNTRYLVPVLSYILDDGRNIFVPIVRGFE